MLFPKQSTNLSQYPITNSYRACNFLHSAKNHNFLTVLLHLKIIIKITIIWKQYVQDNILTYSKWRERALSRYISEKDVIYDVVFIITSVKSVKL
jgi:hypothetical protein